MRRYLLLILLVFETYLYVSAIPYCRVRRYDEYDGLSERRVKQIVQDRDGVLWFATWNGLNRFDGYRFDRIRPKVNDEARAFSERFSDLKLTSQGNLWCRIDDRILLFDTGTYSFRDISSRLEEKLGTDIAVMAIHSTDDGKSVFDCKDGRFIVLTDSLPVETAVVTSERPHLRFTSPGNRKLGDVPPFRNSDLVYSRADSTGRIWLITRDGNVYSAPSLDGDLSHVAAIDDREGHFYYSLTDSQGNVWLRSGTGAYCLSMGESPYTEVPQTQGSVMRAFAKDAQGLTWVSLSDLKALACYDDLSRAPRYLGPEGKLHDTFVPFGAAIYSIGFDSDSRLWLGCKPGGVYRLTPRVGGTYDIDYFGPDPKGCSGPFSDGVYDIESDRFGRLWLAMIDGGIDCVTDPGAESPRFVHLINRDDYPASARRVRDITIAGDTVLLAATTGGLLAFPLPASDDEILYTPFTLHVSEPGREDAIGNIATMHVLAARDGSIYVATESDGVNMLRPFENPLDSASRFVRYNSSAGVPDDVAHALAEDSNDGTVWTVSGNTIYNIDSRSSDIVSFPSVFRPHDVHFSDARPVNVGANRWLVGLEAGAWVIDFDRMVNKKGCSAPVVFTSVSLQNRPDSLLVARTDTLVLAPSERNVTINFSSLSYGETDNIRYSFSLDNNDWTSLGSTHSVTFLDLDPGDYTLRVRASDTTGSRPDSVRELVIIVTPTFWETPLAKCLYVLLILGVIGGIAGTVIYIRRIRRKQRDLLEAYMQLIEKPVTPSTLSEEAATSQPSQPVAPSSPLLSEADEQFMQKVVDFVNANMGNADAGIDEMAAHTATSRSSLNRRMKSLFGVTPADFIRESRLKRAALLLAETDRSITDIALECGFADINYFGKCFKASRKVSPTAFRKNHRDNDE